MFADNLLPPLQMQRDTPKPRHDVAPPVHLVAPAVAPAVEVVVAVAVAVAVEGVGVAAEAAVEAEGEAEAEARPGLLAVGTTTVGLVLLHQTKAARICSATCRKSRMATLWRRAGQCPMMSLTMTTDKNIAPKMSPVE